MTIICSTSWVSVLCSGVIRTWNTITPIIWNSWPLATNWACESLNAFSLIYAWLGTSRAPWTNTIPSQFWIWITNIMLTVTLSSSGSSVRWATLAAISICREDLIRRTDVDRRWRWYVDWCRVERCRNICLVASLETGSVNLEGVTGNTVVWSASRIVPVSSCKIRALNACCLT